MVDKKKAIKQTLSDTVINIISDFIIFTRMSVSIKQIMNLMDPLNPIQMFMPFDEYKGLYNAFYILKINNKSDPDHTLRDSLINLTLSIISNCMDDDIKSQSLCIYERWQSRICAAEETKKQTCENDSTPVKLSYYHRNKEAINENRRLKYAEDHEYREKQISHAKKWRDNNPESYALTVEKQSLRKRNERKGRNKSTNKPDKVYS